MQLTERRVGEVVIIAANGDVTAGQGGRNAGGALTLLRLTKRLKDLRTITKLVTVFDSFDDEAAAIASI